MRLKCIFPNCPNNCIDFSNYCAEHHDPHPGRPVWRVAHKFAMKRLLGPLIPSKCIYPGCPNVCIDFSNYCTVHHNLRTSRPVCKITRKFAMKRFRTLAAKRKRGGITAKKMGTILKVKG